MSESPANLVEAHAHIIAHGRALTMASLRACTSVADALEVVRAEAARLSAAREAPDAWVLASGARIASWADGRWPSRAELDQAAGGRPVCLMSFDHHAVCANARAMQAAGLPDSARDPDGGVIVRDPAGTPTGELLEAAAYLVWHAAPAPALIRQHALAALQDFARLGFVEVHDMLAQPALGPLLASLDRAGELPLRVRLYAPWRDIAAFAREAPAWTTPRVRLAGGKLFADGTLNSRTAWMLAPYAHPLPDFPTGRPVHTPAELREAIAACRDAGVGLAAHAIGDGAVRAMLDAFEEVNPPTHLERRIEHCELIDEADVPRFAALGVAASVQPCHLLYDMEVLSRELPRRLDRVLPLRDLLASGLTPGHTLRFGSDAPIVRPDPQDSIEAAVHRRPISRGQGVPRVQGVPRDTDVSWSPIAPAQALTEAQAWACFRTA